LKKLFIPFVCGQNSVACVAARISSLPRKAADDFLEYMHERYQAHSLFQGGWAFLLDRPMNRQILTGEKS
jgi:hypothetical protein